jgi:hypothetical protein
VVDALLDSLSVNTVYFAGIFKNATRLLFIEKNIHLFSLYTFSGTGKWKFYNSNIFAVRKKKTKKKFAGIL